MGRRQLWSGIFMAVLCMACVWTRANAADKSSVASVLNDSVTRGEKELVSAADAMPEDKYFFAPTSGEFKGVRTFGDEIKHVAAVNYILGASILGEKSPVDVGGESGPTAIKSKADIMKFAKDSYAYLHKAIDSVNEKNMLEPIKNPFWDAPTSRLELAVLAAQHQFDHYGQMVEYLRMNGIVPPASR